MEVDAQAIAKLLGGRREGAGYLCHCPVKGHGKGRGDRRPSLGVSDGDKALVVHCFAGCASTAVLAALRSLSPTGQLPKRLGGLDNRRTPKTTSDYARRLWRASADPRGTPVAVFLGERGLPPDPPATIRYLPSYRYDRAKPKSALPCMIAAVQASTREIVAVQITFLHSSGRRKADVEHPRRAIGPLGDGMLRLAPAGPSMGCAEGFEKAWAAQLLFGEPVWATLGVERYSVVAWPSDTRRLTIYADNDPPGLSGARQFRDDHPDIETRLRYSAHPGEDFDRLYRAVAGERDAAMRRLLEE